MVPVGGRAVPGESPIPIIYRHFPFHLEAGPQRINHHRSGIIPLLRLWNLRNRGPSRKPGNVAALVPEMNPQDADVLVLGRILARRAAIAAAALLYRQFSCGRIRLPAYVNLKTL